MHHSATRLLWLAIVFVCMFGQAAPVPSLNAEATQALVRQMVTNEVAGHDKSPFFYRMDRWERGQRMTSQVVDTDQGTVMRLVCADGKPLSERLKRSDEKRLSRLLNSPEAQRKKIEQDKEDLDKVNHVIQYLADGLLFEYDHGDERFAHLRFKPNPDFKPPNMEARVFQALSGVLVVDREQKRMMRIQGQLIQDVSIGFGIVATLNSGGTFRLEQHELASGYWALSAFEVHMRGRALLIKEINVNEKLQLMEFEPAPSNLTLQRGYDLLKTRGISCAQ